MHRPISHEDRGRPSVHTGSIRGYWVITIVQKRHPNSIRREDRNDANVFVRYTYRPFKTAPSPSPAPSPKTCCVFPAGYSRFIKLYYKLFFGRYVMHKQYIFLLVDQKRIFSPARNTISVIIRRQRLRRAAMTVCEGEIALLT